MPKEFFGTDGIRGVPGTPPLDDATLYATGRALGAHLKREHGAAHALIGMDTRESGPHNPFEDNGVKLFSHAGVKFPDAVEEELEAGILQHRDEAALNNQPAAT